MITIWTPIEEQEPPLGERILIANENGVSGDAFTRKLENGAIQYLRRTGRGFLIKNPTHWAYPPSKSPTHWLNTPISAQEMAFLAHAHGFILTGKECTNWAIEMCDRDDIKTIGAIQLIKAKARGVGSQFDA